MCQRWCTLSPALGEDKTHALEMSLQRMLVSVLGETICWVIDDDHLMQAEVDALDSVLHPQVRHR